MSMNCTSTATVPRLIELQREKSPLVIVLHSVAKWQGDYT